MRSRKWCVGVLCLTFLVLAIWAIPAFAGDTWCSTDPVFLLTWDGGSAQINVIVELSPSEIAGQISEDNPVRVFFRVPGAVNAELVSLSGDFPEEVTIIERGGGRRLWVVVVAPRLNDLRKVRVTVKHGEDILASRQRIGHSVWVTAPIPGY